MDDHTLPSEATWAYGYLAIAYLMTGDDEMAKKAALHAKALIGETRLKNVYSADGYSGIAEVYLALWEKKGSKSNHQKIDTRPIPQSTNRIDDRLSTTTLDQNSQNAECYKNFSAFCM